MNQTETNQQQQQPTPDRELVQMLLRSYFAFRSPVPAEGCIRENKTSLQIRDELEPMYHVDVYDIATWMLLNHYIPTPESDGTVTWNIYRMLDCEV